MPRTILITGSTDGIGLLAAQKLAHLGHIILLHGRDADKLEAARAAVGAVEETYVSDFADPNSVVALADAILAKHSHLDVVINNAGVLKTKNTQTPAGRDIRFEVNAIAPYILTERLLPIVSQNGRIINLSSAAQAPVETDALLSFREMDDMAAYAQSKLAITIWSQELAKTLPNGPIVVSVNPGSLLATKMVQEGFGVPGKDLNIGADILVEAALSDAFATANGQYFDNDSGAFAPPHQMAGDAAHCAAVMDALAKAKNDSQTDKI